MTPTEKTETEIRERAYLIWEASGRPDGQAETHWFQALEELDASPAMTTPEPDETPKPKARAKKATTTAKKAASAVKKASATVAKKAPAKKAAPKKA